MHAAFSDVLWIVCGLGIVAALLSLKGASKEWEAYNQRGMFMESVRSAGAVPVSPHSLDAQRDDEIRQLLEAANNRRARRGEPQLDIEAELTRLTAEAQAPGPAIDPELESEVRALVELRNQRRLRKGQEPLDVDAEIRRELDELGMLHHGERRTG